MVLNCRDKEGAVGAVLQSFEHWVDCTCGRLHRAGIGLRRKETGTGTVERMACLAFFFFPSLHQYFLTTEFTNPSLLFTQVLPYSLYAGFWCSAGHRGPEWSSWGQIGSAGHVLASGQNNDGNQTRCINACSCQPLFCLTFWQHEEVIGNPRAVTSVRQLYLALAEDSI